MSVSHAAVHPVEDLPPPPATAVINGDGGGQEEVVAARPRGLRMKDVQGMPGTRGGLILRAFQFLFAAGSLSVMASTNDFPSVTAFVYLVAAVGLHSLWSLSLAIVDIYALLVKRCLQNSGVVCLFAMGDGITSTLTFAAASASAGITVLIDNDLDICARNHCMQFKTATTLAFFCCFAALPSFLMNFWSLASR